MTYTSEQIAKVKSDLKLYAKNMTAALGFEPELPAHHIPLYNVIEEKILANVNGKLLLSSPPGSGKSFVSVDILVSFMLQNENEDIVIASYSQTISNNLGKRVRKVIQTSQWQALNPGVAFTTDSTSGSFELSNGSSLVCTSVGGSLTSRRCSLMVLDDCLKGLNEAKSNKIIKTLEEWIFSVALTRGYPDRFRVLNLSTRWSSKDAVGLILSAYKENPWPYINIEAICEDEENDILKRQAGESFNSEWKTTEELLAIKTANIEVFDSLYQGKAINKEATYFKPENLQLAKLLPETSGSATTVISWDTASTVGPDSDYSVATVWSVYSIDLMIIKAIYRDKLKFQDLVSLYDKLNKLYRPVTNVVESASSGLQLLQVRPDNSTAAKVFKNADTKEAISKSLNFLMGNQVFIYPSVLTNEIESEILSFPFGLHDDSVLSILHGFQAIKNGLPDSKPSKPQVDYYKMIKRRAGTFSSTRRDHKF